MKKLFAIPVLLLLAVSCGNPYVVQPLQDQSAGKIPCEANQVEVIEYKIDQDGSATWTALCQGYTYNCNRLSGYDGEVNCSRMESQMPE